MSVRIESAPLSHDYLGKETVFESNIFRHSGIPAVSTSFCTPALATTGE